MYDILLHIYYLLLFVILISTTIFNLNKLLSLNRKGIPFERGFNPISFNQIRITIFNTFSFFSTRLVIFNFRH